MAVADRPTTSPWPLARPAESGSTSKNQRPIWVAASKPQTASMIFILRDVRFSSSAPEYAVVEDPRDRIDNFRDLEQDWDTYGAEPITTAAREQAKALITKAMERNSSARPYAVAPIPDGGVFIEWRGPANDILEVEVDKMGHLDIVVQLATGQEIEKSSVDIDNVLSQLSGVLHTVSPIRA